MVNIAAVAATGAVLSVFLRKVSEQYAAVCSIACGILIVIMILPWTAESLKFADELITHSEIPAKYVKLILKAVSSAYIAQFTSDMCEDIGERTLASRVQIAEKLYIAALSIPLFYDIILFIEKMTEF